MKSSSYYYKAVLWAVENGITTGTGATQFSPGDYCTRGQVVTFLWRTNGAPVLNGSGGFKDVAKGAFYYDAVVWAVENKITSGVTQWEFAPKDSCTRGQVVTFLQRACA